MHQESATAFADNLIAVFKGMLRSHDQKIEALNKSGASLKAAIDVVSSLPPPQNGKDGKDGKDADMDGIKALIADAMAGISLPKDGVGVTLDELRPLIASAVHEEIAKIPLPHDGKDVDPESVRGMVKDVFDAMPRAIDGADGRDGLDGRDGRDALELEIMAEIDEQKSYPRGTYAMHDGGLWRSHERTSAMRGWECLVQGVTDIRVDQGADRSIVITTRKSSGMEIVTTLDLPVMIYRGVYTESDYRAGDMVTWGGSLWHCNEPTRLKPGVGNQWTLCVKHGRDGKMSK